MKTIGYIALSVGIFMLVLACAPAHTNTAAPNRAKTQGTQVRVSTTTPPLHYLDHHQGHLSASRPLR